MYTTIYIYTCIHIHIMNKLIMMIMIMIITTISIIIIISMMMFVSRPLAGRLADPGVLLRGWPNMRSFELLFNVKCIPTSYVRQMTRMGSYGVMWGRL